MQRSVRSIRSTLRIFVAVVFSFVSRNTAAQTNKDPPSSSSSGDSDPKKSADGPDKPTQQPAPDNDTITVEVVGDYALVDKDLSGLAKPQKLMVREAHRRVWLWVPYEPANACYRVDRANRTIDFPSQFVGFEQLGSTQPLAPRVVALIGPKSSKASSDDTGADTAKKSEPVQKAETEAEKQRGAATKAAAEAKIAVEKAAAHGATRAEKAEAERLKANAAAAQTAAAAADADADAAEAEAAATKAVADRKAATERANAANAAAKAMAEAEAAAADAQRAAETVASKTATAEEKARARAKEAEAKATAEKKGLEAEREEVVAEGGRTNDQDIKYATVVLPPLQFGISYCLGFGSVNDSQPTAVALRRVPWPLNDSTVSWWSQRYVTAAVGFGYSGGMSWGTTPAGYDAAASAFVYVGAHITPWPTDRHIPIQDRVSTSFAQHFHIIVAAAVTDPWPNANTVPQLGARGLLLGAGLSGGDNVIAASVGLVVGEGSYDQVDALGNVHNRKVTLVSPVIGISTQADIVNLFAKAFGK